MRWMWCWGALGCLVIALPSSAADSQKITPDQLPAGVTDHIRKGFDAEPQFARKEVEGGRARYLVTATLKGQVIEIYASPDGHVLIQKTEEFSLARWLDQLADASLFVLLPGVVVGVVARGVVRSARGRQLSVPEGWLSAWVGTGVVMALVVFNLATVPREKDVPVLGAYCVIWAAIAASVGEVIVLALRTGSGHEERAVRRRVAIRCCVVAAVSMALTIPLDMLRIERVNQHAKYRTLWPPGD